jgi:hypothetical protein
MKLEQETCIDGVWYPAGSEDPRPVKKAEPKAEPAEKPARKKE